MIFPLFYIVFVLFRLASFIRKILLWDFIRLLNERDDLDFLGKIRAYLSEYVHKLNRLVIRNHAFYRGRHFEQFIEELREKKLEEVPCNLCVLD